MPNNKPINDNGQTQRAVMTARTKPFLKSWLRNDPMRCCCVLLCRSLLGWESGAMGTYYCSTARQYGSGYEIEEGAVRHFGQL